MKRKLILAALFIAILFTKHSFGQVDLGVKGGFNLSKAIGKDPGYDYSDELEVLPGFHVGGIIELFPEGVISLQSELLISTKGYKDKEPDYTETLNFYYLELPILLKASFDLGDIELHGTIGPYGGIALMGYYEDKSDGDVYKEKVDFGKDSDFELRKGDFGYVIGVGAGIDNFIFGISYYRGLANLFTYSDIMDTNLKLGNRTLAISVGYMFGD